MDDRPARRDAVARMQWDKLRTLLAALFPANRFYTEKFQAAGAPRAVPSLAEFSRQIPFTLKTELVADQEAHPPFGTNLTFPLDHYTRCHQTSGTTRTPIRWLDTPQSWDAMLDHWARVYEAAGVRRGDRAFFAFSFGPFIGFWSAFEAAARLGCLCFTGGAMNSLARLRAILDQGATVLCCTPTYALHLAEVAGKEGVDLRASQVRVILVAGEPGGSLPATRARIEALWPGAQVRDHHGMTEVGPVSYECPARPGVLHVIEASFIAEVVDPPTGQPVSPGQTGELVLTTLHRIGSPLLRYRTGDLVKAPAEGVCICGTSDHALEGGILGRADDMVLVRGVNIFPSAVEEIIRRCPGVVEYQVRFDASRPLAELSIQIEPAADCPDVRAVVKRVENELESTFHLRLPVAAVAPGTLPRFEMKARRWIKVGSPG
jgi:phenylacetate-CoA ligase